MTVYYGNLVTHHTFNYIIEIHIAITSEQFLRQHHNLLYTIGHAICNVTSIFVLCSL